MFSYYQTPIWWKSLRSSKKKKTPIFLLTVNIMVWLMVLQWLKKTLHLCCRGGRRGGTVSHWWIICLLISEWHSGVWIKGLLSCFSHKRGLSGVTPQRGTAVRAWCPVELSLYSGLATHRSVSSFLPEAWVGTISCDISNGLIVASNARSIALPVRLWMNQYPGVNSHVSACFCKAFIWHFSVLHLTDSDQHVSKSTVVGSQEITMMTAIKLLCAELN